ncbi:MAG: methylmalonyl-CoA mutase family protein [Pseudomonadota bacterium]
MTSKDLDLSTFFPPRSYADWRAAAEATLKGAPFDKVAVSRLHEGFSVQPVYGPADAPAADAAGMPGLAPFTRGGAPVPDREAGWDVRQRYAYAEPECLAAALATDMAHGLGSAWIELDGATRAGLDPDDEQALFLAGRGGLLASTAQDLMDTLASADLTAFPVSFGGGSLPLAALHIVAAQARGVAPAHLRGSLGLDPFGALAADGRLPGSLEQALAELSDLAAWCHAEAPGLRAVHVSTVPHHAAGASAVQELGIALATGVAYLRAMEAHGLSVHIAAPQVLFVFALRGDLFLEIAKLRAARALWARVVAACGGGEAEQRMVLHARTSPWDRTACDPWVNLLRSTTEGFAAAVGGADSIATGPFDEALGPPDATSRRIAANIQHLLRDESHLHLVADPAGGSHYVEHLTQQLIAAGWAELQAIEAQGGVAAALDSGWLAERIGAVAQGRATAAARRRDPITGVSEFPMLDEAAVERPTADPDDVADLAGCALAAWRADHPMVRLDPLQEAVVGQGLATRAALAVAADGATLGAMAAALRSDGAPLRRAPLLAVRQAEPFEALRAAADRYRAACGHHPRIFLANLGPVPKHRVRALWIANLLAAGGFEALDVGGFDSPEAAATACARAVQEQGALAAVICGPDPAYPELVPVLAPGLLAAGARQVLLAGRPAAEHEAAWRAAGVGRFLFFGGDVLADLQALQRDLGVQA